MRRQTEALSTGKRDAKLGEKGRFKKGLKKLGAGRPRAKILMAFVLMGGLRIPLLFGGLRYRDLTV